MQVAEVKKCTVNELCKMMNIEYPAANVLLKMMVEKELAKVVGKRPSLTGKGKPSVIYEVPSEITLKLF